jgi:hypothetical protein
MNAEWVTAIATVFTALVIAASAVAALLQIRHMRKGNEIELIQNWTEGIESERFQQARSFVTRELPRILQDPARVHALSWDPLPAELAPVRTVCNHFEAIGTFIRLGSVEAKVALQLWGLVVLDCWRAVAPIIAMIRRRVHTDALWENFEYLAVLSDQWIEEHGEGTYPRATRRMPEDRSLIDMLSEKREAV